MWAAALLLVGAQAAPIAPIPTACNGQPAVVDGVTYKTRVFLVQEGFPATPIVTNNSKVKVTVKATLAATGATFPFEFPNPLQYVLPPTRGNGMIVGFDVGLGALPSPCGGGQCGMAKDSTRMLCIPPEEGFGAVARPGIPANSTLLIEIKCVEIIAPAKGLPCNPHGTPPEHCPGGEVCPPSGMCPLPPAPAPPPAPPGPPLPPAPPTGKCTGPSKSLAASDCQAWTDIFDATGCDFVTFSHHCVTFPHHCVTFSHHCVTFPHHCVTFSHHCVTFSHHCVTFPHHCVTFSQYCFFAAGPSGRPAATVASTHAPATTGR